jgi:DNA-binding NtrC family response regulator
VEEKITILIAERNPHVREFLKREMTAEGYRIYLAESGKEVLKYVYNPGPLDLLIIDPDLPDAEINSILKKLQGRIPRLPVILHVFPSDYPEYSGILEDAVFVEKKGNSIEGLKNVIFEILRKRL